MSKKITVYEVVEYPGPAYVQAGHTFPEEAVAWFNDGMDARLFAQVLSGQYNSTKFKLGNRVEIEVPD